MATLYTIYGNISIDRLTIFTGIYSCNLYIYGNSVIRYNKAIKEKWLYIWAHERGLFMTEENKVSKAQQKAVHKYVKANYDRLELTVPKGFKDQIKAAAAAAGESVNGYIKTAVERRMESD